MAARATADPPMDCKSQCQEHTNESRRPEATIAAKATKARRASTVYWETSGDKCAIMWTRAHSIQSVLGDKWETSGDKCAIMRTRAPTASSVLGDKWETSGDKWETSLKSRGQRI